MFFVNNRQITNSKWFHVTFDNNFPKCSQRHLKFVCIAIYQSNLIFSNVTILQWFLNNTILR